MKIMLTRSVRKPASLSFLFLLAFSMLFLTPPTAKASYLTTQTGSNASGELVLAQTFQSPTQSTSDHFGFSIAAVGNNVLVGAPDDNTGGTDSGAAYLFNGSTGALIRTFLNPNHQLYGQFGWSVAALGDNILVSAPSDSTFAFNGGVVYLFDGSTGSLLQTFPNPNPEPSGGAYDSFGWDVSALGSNVIVGAPGDSMAGFFTGTVYLFDGSTGGLLQTFPDPNPEPFTGFGRVVIALDNNVVVGAPDDSTAGPATGAVYFFDSLTGSLIRTFLTPNATPNYDEYGYTVAALGSNMLVGAPGGTSTTYLIDVSTGDLMWTFSSSGVNSPLALVALGNNVLVGAWADFTFGTYVGAAYVVDGSTGNLLQTMRNPNEGDQTYNLFGFAVAAMGTGGLVSRPSISVTGAVYLFQPTPALTPVHNVNTGLDYATIQEAISAIETVDGHTILVDAGTYYEHVTVSKSLTLVGEDPANTIIDGSGTGNIVNITASNVYLNGFTLQNGGTGVWMAAFSGNNTISGSNITGNMGSGIMLEFSSYNTISENNITNNWYGIGLGYSSNNKISGNAVTENDADGISLYWSANNSISGNDVMNNSVGISLASSQNNSISENSVTDNSYGITLWEFSSDNEFYHNTLINNANQVVFYYGNPVSIWDDGYPSGGNYWSNYTGVDEMSGPAQDQAGGDGIGDTPYILDVDNKDRYPLMRPWTEAHPPLVANVDVDPNTSNLKSHSRWMTAYIELPQGFDVAKIDLLSIRLNGTISLAIDVPATIGDYDTDGISDLMVKFSMSEVKSLFNGQGSYVLQITGNLTDGIFQPFEGSDTIRVMLPGDVNHDGFVNILDAALVAYSYGSRLGDARWDVNADLVADNVINILDAAQVAYYYGTKA